MSNSKEICLIVSIARINNHMGILMIRLRQFANAKLQFELRDRHMCEARVLAGDQPCKRNGMC